MSCLDSDMPISELIERIKHSFRERDFKKILDLVMERENTLRKEIQNLTWDRDLARNEARLLDRNVELLELERSQFEEKLRKGQRKCKELEETVARLHLKIADSREMKLDYDEIISELRLKKMESDKEAEMYKIRLEKSARTSKAIEEKLANVLKTAKMGDIATCENGTSEERGNLDSQGFRGTGENDDAEVVVIDVLSPSNGSRNYGLPMEGGKNSVQPRARENGDDAHEVKTFPVTLSGHNPPQEENNERKEPLVPGTRGGGLQLFSCSSKYACSSPAANGSIVEIIDSDEDTCPGGVTQTPRVGIFYPKVVTNETNLVLTPLSSQTSMQDRADSGDGLFLHFTTKRKRDACTGDVDRTASIHEKGNQILKPTRFGMDSSLEKFNCVSDDDSADSEDDSLSDSRMVEMIDSLRSGQISRKVAGFSS